MINKTEERMNTGITLEQIEGMNISVGTPIELIFEHFKGESLVKKLVYFNGITKVGFGVDSPLSEDALVYKERLGDSNLPKRSTYPLSQIDEIRVLKYQEPSQLTLFPENKEGEKFIQELNENGRRK